MTQKALRERDEAREELRKLCPPGTTLQTVLRHVSRSGMYRAIDVYLMACDEGEVSKRWLSRLVAKATGSRFDEKYEAIGVGGCGMDMGFAIVHELSYALYPKGFTCLGDGGDQRRRRCPANDHSNGDRNYQPHDHPQAGGYALRQEWL